MAETKERLRPEEIVDRFYDDVYKFCCARCRDADTALDLTQETFAVMMEKRDEVEDENLRAWLFSVADRRVRSYFRDRAEEKDFVSIYDLPQKTFDWNVVEDEAIGRITLTETQEKILSILTEKERELFLKLYFEKKPVPVIRDELGITDANLRQRKHRIRRKIKGIVGNMAFLAVVVTFKLTH